MPSALDLIAESLPRSFSFYHLGQIELQDEAEVLSATGHLGFLASVDRVAAAYVLQGEVRGVLVLVFDQGLDVSTYSEAGNIIASQLANGLEERQGMVVSISPPRILSGGQLQNLLGNGQGVARTYLHRHGNRVIPLQALLVPASVVPSEGTGNA
jgi:chemotaxis protein CheY-P-specific phosphatase CheC